MHCCKNMIKDAYELQVKHQRHILPVCIDWYVLCKAMIASNTFL